MAAGKVGSVWADGTWSETAWEENTWRDAIAAFPLFTEGAYMMVDMGGGRIRGIELDWRQNEQAVGILLRPPRRSS